ncbi:MAG: tRNA-dihydrouridine synthase family protein [Desulfobulbaceae bacterium]|nr:MAG: tRNA-dihydrouridine synthase family protein [Desulfobulbaceae bacterium]
MSFSVRGLTIDPPIALAPMVGLSHSALRQLVAGFGGTGLYFTEMLSAKRLPSENEKKSPYLLRTGKEHPLIFQLYFIDEAHIEEAIAKAHQFNAQGIDINLGCGAPNIKKMGAGQSLLDNAAGVERVIRSIRRKTELPLSAKIRIGYEENAAKLREICLRLQNYGLDYLTIHARLVGEKFCRKPRWHILKKTINSLSIPVLVNGGIYSVKDARMCLDITGAHGLMIGRAGAQKPWLMRDIAHQLYKHEAISPDKNLDQIYYVFMNFLRDFPPERQLGRLKQFTHYFAKNFVFGHKFASMIQNAKSMDEAFTCTNRFFSSNDEILQMEMTS